MNNYSVIVKNKVLSALNEYSMLENAKTVLVGFSGGADSVCLLHLLNSLKGELTINVKATHINHGIRGDEAKRDMDFAISFCADNNIPIKTFSFDCVSEAKRSKESLEECGRRLRYQAFSELCDDSTKIATAHNANDNAETVLFNLSRGASVKGVCGIPPVRDNIIRPLIYCSREEIEGYCKENDLSFVTDSTNLCDDYTRNKIRHNALPVLCEVNSSAVSNITNLSQSARDVCEFILFEAQNALDKAFVLENTYDAGFLKTLHKAVLNEVIVIAYSRFSCDSLNREKINMISELISSGGRIQIYGNETVEVVKGKLRFFLSQDNINVHSEIKISYRGEYSFGEYLVNISDFTDYSKNINRNVLDNLIDCDKINGNLFLRSRKEGDKFDLYKRNVSKSLKKLFCELNIPVEKRDEIPVLCDDDGVVWIYSVGTCARCHITDSSSNIIYVRGENNG